MNLLKNFLLILLLVLSITLVASCNDDPSPVTPTPGPSDKDDPEEPVFDFMGQDFVIMVDLPSSVDPRSPTYQKLFKEEKAALIEKVEKKYNLNVVYKAYPSEASWGGARERYIINKSVSGIKDVHVYEVPSYSIGTLAVSKAIQPLSNYIEKYGNKGYWPEVKAAGTALGEIYGYGDFYSLADEGIYYNEEIMKQVFGDENADLPSQLWLKGEWTWEKFEEICKQLDENLPEDYFVMGGTCYNWAYQFLGSNGVHLVDTDLNCQLDTQPAIDTITYLNGLYAKYRWDATTPSLSNATSTHMVEGKVAFHNGQSYWIFTDGKWKQRDPYFGIGYVPYPVGPNITDKENLTGYCSNNVYGTSQYTISSSFSKDNVPEGYEDSTLYDEIIFKIWSELQYFPEIDSKTGYASTTDVFEEYRYSRLEKYYANDASVEAHLSVIMKAYPDYFYSLDESKAQVEGSYMLMLQAAIKDGTAENIRSQMINLKKLIEESFKQKYNLPADYYGTNE